MTVIYKQNVMERKREMGLGRSYEPPVPDENDKDMVFEDRDVSKAQIVQHSKREIAHAFRLSLLGCGNREMAEFFNVTESVIETWRRSHPEFEEAIKRGKQHASMNVVKSLYKMCIGFDVVETKVMEGTNAKGDPVSYKITNTRYVQPNIKAIMYYLQNKEKNLWSDTSRVEISGTVGEAKQLDISKFSAEEQKLAKKLAILQLAGINGTSNN